MPVEVISLLSSPDVAPSRPTAQSKQPSRPRPEPPKRMLDYDMFDLTDSPQFAAPKGAPPETSREGPSPSPQLNQPSNRHTLYHDDFLFLSDDFDTTGDLGESSRVEIGDRLVKKPRLPHSPVAGNDSNHGARQRLVSASSRTANGPSVLQPSRSKRWNTVADPIEFTSSPHAVTPSSQARNDVEDDPFASSPRKSKPAMAEKRATINSLTFTLSTNKENISVPAQSGLQGLSSDPFASSPPRPVPKVDVMDPTAWDHISSSAPEASFRSDSVPSPSRGLTRSHSEIIDLADSDAAAASSDDEFPDLESADLTKLKFRHVTSKALATRYEHTRPANVSKPISRKTAAEKAREQESKTAAKEAEKVRKQKEKEVAKQQRAQEKEKAAALAEVNKIRTDKKISTPEMIVDLSASLNQTTTVQIQTLLSDLSVQNYSWQSPVDNVVKWRRKVSSRYNDDLGHWEPIPMHIAPEKHALVIMTANDFVSLALGAEGADLDAHVLKMREHFAGHTLMYLIEGLTAWMRKNRNVRNRQFVSAVRNAGEEAAGSGSVPSASQQQPSRRRKNAQPQEYISEDSVEDALLNLQVLHGALIHHTSAPVETAQWVAVFTQHISTIPYRRQREQNNAESAAFCMESGQVRTGDGPKDTYVRMLQEIARVTAPIAYGIAAEFGSVSELVRGLEAGGPLRLESVKKSANKDGAFSDRNIGQAVSRRIYKVFTGRDDRSTDI